MKTIKRLLLLVLLTTGILLIRAGYELYARQINVNLEIGKRLFCHHVRSVLTDLTLPKCLNSFFGPNFARGDLLLIGPFGHFVD